MKIGSGVASAGLIIAGFAHTAGAQDATISDNGADSDNAIIVTENNSVDLTQSNTNDSTVSLTVTNNSGNNTANDNTNTDGGITTGDSTTSLNVTVGGMVNEAAVDPCGCEPDDDDADDADGLTISGNGARSVNTVDVAKTNDVVATQENDNNTEVVGTVDNNSGDNEASGNTGGDDDEINGDDTNGTTDRRSRIRTGSNNTTANVTIRGSRNSFFRMNGLTFSNGL